MFTLDNFDRLFRSKEKTEATLELVKQLAPIKELQRQAQAEILEKRRAAVVAIDEARRIKAERLPALQQAERDAQDRIERAEAEHRAAKIAFMHSQCDRFAVGEFDLQISKAQGILRETAPQELLEFEYWLLKEDETTRHKVESKRGIMPGGDLFSKVIVISNSTYVNARCEVIRKTLKRVEEMKFEVIEDIAAEIAALKASIPPADYPTERIEGEVPRIESPAPERYSSEPEKPRLLQTKEIIW